MKKIGPFLFGILVSLSNIGFSQIDLGTVIITGTRIPVSFSKATRDVTIIDRESIKNAPVSSIAELLDFVLGVDTQERQKWAVQSDITIRGATFQQTLILIDGVRLNDPQTAHHNMDIPITLNDIERIEVLRGHSSSVYGPDAFGGVINIITREPKDKKIHTELIYGENNTWTGGVSISKKWKKFGQLLSIEKKKSDGFRDGTDFDTLNFTGKSYLKTSLADFSLFLGLNNKDFGAYHFYSSLTENEREKTETKFINLNSNIPLTDLVSIEPKIYFRQHNDRFEYIYSENSYQNTHTTYQGGVDIQTLINLLNHRMLILGGEFIYEMVESSNMGNHNQNRVAFYFEYKTSLFKHSSVELGLHSDYHSLWGWQVSPTMSIGCKATERLKLHSSVGWAFRSPSFTELYYETPVNKGNASLKPEKTLSYEIGTDYFLDSISLGMTVFRREESNLIDWIKEKETDTQWLAENIGKVDVNGVEINSKIEINPFLFSINYTFINFRTYKDYISKYALRQPEHQCSFHAAVSIGEITTNLQCVYKKRTNEEGYFLLNSSLLKKFGNIEIFFKGTNLLNTSYEEVKAVPTAGRWLWGGVRFQI